MSKLPEIQTLESKIQIIKSFIETQKQKISFHQKVLDSAIIDLSSLENAKHLLENSP